MKKIYFAFWKYKIGVLGVLGSGIGYLVDNMLIGMIIGLGIGTILEIITKDKKINDI